MTVAGTVDGVSTRKLRPQPPWCAPRCGWLTWQAFRAAQREAKRWEGTDHELERAFPGSALMAATATMWLTVSGVVYRSGNAVVGMLPVSSRRQLAHVAPLLIAFEATALYLLATQGLLAMVVLAAAVLGPIFVGGLLQKRAMARHQKRWAPEGVRAYKREWDKANGGRKNRPSERRSGFRTITALAGQSDAPRLLVTLNRQELDRLALIRKELDRQELDRQELDRQELIRQELTPAYLVAANLDLAKRYAKFGAQLAGAPYFGRQAMILPDAEGRQELRQERKERRESQSSSTADLDIDLRDKVRNSDDGLHEDQPARFPPHRHDDGLEEDPNHEP
jgi:hypothetical protein